MTLQRATFQYDSRADDTAGLLADACYQDDGQKKPIVLIMHGYKGGRKNVSQDLSDLAGRGLFTVAPDMRGRGDSPGRWDSGGLDVHDAVDAALAAACRYPEQADPDNLNIVGYSGGGGNAYAAGCRFPDHFQTAVSFFGIADYAGWHASRGRPDCNRTMDEILGRPDEHPARYEARNMILAAGNAMKTHWWLFWDEEESQCPPAECDEPWADAYRATGGEHLRVEISRSGDEYRWHHGYRINHPSLAKANDIFCDALLAPPRDLSLPEEGELVVPGYLVTKPFRVFIGDGQAGCVRIRYRLQPSVEVDVIENPRNLPVNISS
jgi:pimeloyl-ACP methyl ester carboxylesterase